MFSPQPGSKRKKKKGLPGPTPIGLKVLARAKSWLNTHEKPMGSNLGRPYPEAWQKRAANGTVGFPWCAAFLWCMFDDCGMRLGIQWPASVASWVDWADSRGFVVKRPFRGFVVAFSFDGRTNHPNDHIGVVEKVLGLPRFLGGSYFIKTIEGNHNDAVRRVWRRVDPKTVVFIRVP